MATPNEPQITPPTLEAAQPRTNAAACPLARDRLGNAIEVPPAAAAWGVRRKTGGRPRIMLGVDGRPLHLPLAYTIVDLENVLAPAEYMLDLVDVAGKPVGGGVEVSIGRIVTEREDDDLDPEGEPTAAPSEPAAAMLVTQMRLVLDANVRATQLAFQHNEKTAEVGLRAAEALRDAVRSMADSQADWIKSLASARGFFRNAPAALPAPVVAPSAVEEDDDDEEMNGRGDYEEARDEVEPHWVDKLMPHVVTLCQTVAPMAVAWATSKRPSSRPDSGASGARTKPPFHWTDMFNWKKTHERLTAAREAAAREDAAKAGPSSESTEAAAVPPLGPEEMAHFIAIQSALTPDEANLARAVAAELSPVDLRTWLAELMQLSVPDAVAKIRAALSGAAA